MRTCCCEAAWAVAVFLPPSLIHTVVVRLGWACVINSCCMSCCLLAVKYIVYHLCSVPVFNTQGGQFGWLWYNSPARQCRWCSYLCWISHWHVCCFIRGAYVRSLVVLVALQIVAVRLSSAVGVAGWTSAAQALLALPYNPLSSE